jgi:hypothetical protein
MPLTQLKASFHAYLPAELVEQLFETYSEVKKNFWQRRLRPNEVEGGRFAEAIFRILEHRTTGRYTPLGTPLNTDNIIRALAQIPSPIQPDSVRLHIPRTLRVIYDIRNKRDAAHLADKIDPNLQDATIVVSCCEWVLAELVRLYHNADPNMAQREIETIVKRRVPIIQEFGTTLKTLNPKLSLAERLLVLLYFRDQQGATAGELSNWIKPKQKKNLKSTLWHLEHEKDLIHEENGLFLITSAGQFNVEEDDLLCV